MTSTWGGHGGPPYETSKIEHLCRSLVGVALRATQLSSFISENAAVLPIRTDWRKHLCLRKERSDVVNGKVRAIRLVWTSATFLMREFMARARCRACRQSIDTTLIEMPFRQSPRSQEKGSPLAAIASSCERLCRTAAKDQTTTAHSLDQ